MQIFPVFFVICIAFAVFFGGDRRQAAFFVVRGGTPEQQKDTQ